MYQWRKFEFFEEKYGGKIPEDVTGEIQCCSSGRGKVVIGSSDGSVSFLDRGIKFDSGFQAHSSSVLFLQHLKVLLHFSIFDQILKLMISSVIRLLVSSTKEL